MIYCFFFLIKVYKIIQHNKLPELLEYLLLNKFVSCSLLFYNKLT